MALGQGSCCAAPRGDREVAQASGHSQGPWRPAAGWLVTESPRLLGAPPRCHQPWAEGTGGLWGPDAAPQGCSEPISEYKAFVLPGARSDKQRRKRRQQRTSENVAGMRVASSSLHGGRAFSPAVILVCWCRGWGRRRGSPMGDPVPSWASHPPSPLLGESPGWRSAACSAGGYRNGPLAKPLLGSVSLALLGSCHQNLSHFQHRL